MGFLYGAAHISGTNATARTNLVSGTGNITISSNFTLEANQVVPGGPGNTRGGLGIGSNTNIAITGASNASAITISGNLSGAGAGVSANRVNGLNIHGTEVNISNPNGDVNLLGNTSNIIITGTYVGAVRDKAWGNHTITGNNVTFNGTTSVLANSTFFATTRGVYAYSSQITGTNSVNMVGKVVAPGISPSYQAVGLAFPTILGRSISITSLKAATATPNTTTVAGIYS